MHFYSAFEPVLDLGERETFTEYKNTVTECYGLLSLSANFIAQHTDYRRIAKPPNYTAGAG